VWSVNSSYTEPPDRTGVRHPGKIAKLSPEMFVSGLAWRQLGACLQWGRKAPTIPKMDGRN
jgi:hypothetical protein